MAVCALASRKADGAPIKWSETRTEHMQASAHGNERTFLDTRVALDKNGVITAVKSKHLDDCGAYPRYEPLGQRNLVAGNSSDLPVEELAH